MTREQKLETIYKEIANKELTFGCKYLVSDITDWGDFFTRENEGECLSFRWCSEDLVFLFWEEERKTYKLKEIIGHPIMIWTIFERYSSSRWFINSQFITKLVDKWTSYDKPINEQSDECVDFIYSLIQKS